MKSNALNDKKKYQPRQQRIFSVELKKKLVEQIELKKLQVSEVSKLYKVSTNSVYTWIRKYSITHKEGVKMVVESQSHETKLEKLFQRISELEQNVGRKQLQIEFLEKVIELCSEELGYDVKKKHTTTH